MGSGTDVKSLATFSSGPDPSERPRRNPRRNAPAEAPRLKLRVLRLLLRDPVLQRGHLLDELLLARIALLRRQINLLLHAISAQRTHILEGSRSDVIIADTLRTEADVHALHVGIRVPLTLQQGQIVPKPVEDSPLHQDQWLDNQDLSQLLHVSVRSLQRYRSLGILPYKMMHKKTYYTKEGWNGKPYKTK